MAKLQEKVPFAILMRAHAHAGVCTQRAELTTQLEELTAYHTWLKKGSKGKAPKFSSEEEQAKKRSTGVLLLSQSLLIAHWFVLALGHPTDPAKIQGQLEKLEERLAALETQITQKDEGKTVALGTSKINYMDPRITVSWCKALEVSRDLRFSCHNSIVCRLKVPLEKVFPKTLSEKFPWAMEVLSDWKF